MFSERYSTLVCVCVCVCSCSCSAEGYNCDKFLIALELIPKRAQDARVWNYSSEPGFGEAHKENRHKTITSMFIKMYALHYNFNYNTKFTECVRNETFSQRLDTYPAN